jgi:hypothetical protein
MRAVHSRRDARSDGGPLGGWYHTRPSGRGTELRHAADVSHQYVSQGNPDGPTWRQGGFSPLTAAQNPATGDGTTGGAGATRISIG